MPSAATRVFAQIDNDIEALLGLHTGSGDPGRPVGNNGPLMRSAIVLLVTAWENYVEQAVTEVLDHSQPAVAADHRLLSAHLRDAAAKKAKDDAWAVVHDGWRTVARKRADHEIRVFNNAATRQTNELVSKVLGIDSILDGVSWGSPKRQGAQSDLTQLVNDIGRFVGNLVKSFDTALADAAGTTYGPPLVARTARARRRQTRAERLSAAAGTTPAPAGLLAAETRGPSGARPALGARRLCGPRAVASP